MDQQKVGGNELARAEEIVNPISVFSPELRQKRDGLARQMALPIIFVKQDRNRSSGHAHIPVIPSSCVDAA
jgi:hypothetical protein